MILILFLATFFQADCQVFEQFHDLNRSTAYEQDIDLIMHHPIPIEAIYLEPTGHKAIEDYAGLILNLLVILFLMNLWRLDRL